MEAATNVYNTVAELIESDALNRINVEYVWTKKSNIYRTGMVVGDNIIFNRRQNQKLKNISQWKEDREENRLWVTRIKTEDGREAISMHKNRSMGKKLATSLLTEKRTFLKVSKIKSIKKKFENHEPNISQVSPVQQNQVSQAPQLQRPLQHPLVTPMSPSSPIFPHSPSYYLNWD